MSTQILEPLKKQSYWLPYWENYLKKIPKTGLNNLTKTKSYDWKGQKIIYDNGGKPTLPRRLEKIVVMGLFGCGLPFFYYHMEMITHKKELKNLEKVQELTKLILEQLEVLYHKIDAVNVLSDKELEYWKLKLKETRLYIRKQSKFIGLKLIQEAEFKKLQG